MATPVKTEIRYIKPPAVWLEPRVIPARPVYHEGMLVVDFLKMNKEYLEVLKIAATLSELDKRMIREWCEKEGTK